MGVWLEPEEAAEVSRLWATVSSCCTVQASIPGRPRVNPVERFHQEYGGPCKPVLVVIERDWYNAIYEDCRKMAERYSAKPWPKEPPDHYLLFGIRVEPEIEASKRGRPKRVNPEHLKRAEESAARVEDILLHVPDKKVEAAIADYLATQFEEVEQPYRSALEKAEEGTVFEEHRKHENRRHVICRICFKEVRPVKTTDHAPDCPFAVLREKIG